MPVYGEPYVSPHLLICLNQRGWVKAEYDMQPVEFYQYGLSVVFPDHVVLARESSPDYLATLVVVSRKFLETLNHRSTYRNHLEYLRKPDFTLTKEQLMQFGMDGKQSLAKGTYELFVGGGQPGFTENVLSAKVDM